MTRRIMLSAAVALLLVGGGASAEAGPNPLDQFRRDLERDIRHVMRYHAARHRVRQPVMVKATPDEPPAPAHAATGIPDAVLPLPEARPVETPAASPAATARSDVPDAVLPLPEARPAEPPATMLRLPTPRPPVAAREAAADLPPSPKQGKPAVKLAALTPPSGELEEKPATGASALAALGVKSIRLEPIEQGACTVLDPVAVASLESGAVSLSSKATFNQRMAETVAKWVHEDVMPAAHDILVGELTGLRILDSYSCRSRDNVAGAKISEHGFADAVDIGAFRIGKRWVEVGGDKHNAADDARFLDTVRHAACRRFTTVLGPGEPDHDTHFHLDLGRHGKSGKYTICQ